MAPFPEYKQLCDKLIIGANSHLLRRSSVSPTKNSMKNDHLPGEPRLELEDNGISEYLRSEFMTGILDDLSPYLWLVATQNSAHVSSLTYQVVRGRNIIITENPGLHLVWIYDKVFIKPMPKYLLSHAFWQFYLIDPNSTIPAHQREGIKKAALGFMRSYAYLIRHKSDFNLATNDDHRLLPKKIKHSAFIKFILHFKDIPDESVSSRYKFGELRLSRLNFWVTIFLGHFTYHNVHGYYSAYFARFFGPLLFIFALLSVLLSAMQVALAVGQPLNDGSWVVFAYTCRGFATSSIVGVALATAFLLSMFIFRSSRETIFALKDLHRKHRLRMTGSSP